MSHNDETAFEHSVLAGHRPNCLFTTGGQGQGRPADLPLFRKEDIPTALSLTKREPSPGCAEAATRLGFQGPMTQTPPGIELTAEVITLAEALGPFPHARLDRAAADAPAPGQLGAVPAPDLGGKVHSGPRQAGHPHDQADRRRMLRLHRPHHPQMARPGLPAVPTRPAHGRGVTRPATSLNPFKRPRSSRTGAFKRPQTPGIPGTRIRHPA